MGQLTYVRKVWDWVLLLFDRVTIWLPYCNGDMDTNGRICKKRSRQLLMIDFQILYECLFVRMCSCISVYLDSKQGIQF